MMDYEEKLPFKKQIKLMKDVLVYAKPYWKGILFAFFIVVSVSYLNVLIPKMISSILDLDFSASFTYGPLYQLIITLAITILIWAVAKYLEFYLMSRAAFLSARDLRNDLFEKVQTLGMRYFDQTPIGSIVSRITNDTEAIEEMFVSVFGDVLTSAVGILGVLIAMLLLDQTLGLIALVLVPLIVLILWLYQKLSTPHYQTARHQLSRINTRVAESIAGMSMIQAFNQESRMTEEFKATDQAYINARMKSLMSEAFLLAPAFELLMALGTIIVLLVFGVLSLNEPVQVSLVFLFVQYIRNLFSPLYNLMERISIYQQALVATQRVLHLKSHPTVNPIQNNHDIKVTDGVVEFKHVTFSYDDINPVLNDISFEVKQGEMLALVGHTGSGKSSIINVLMRFYEFQEGKVLIDGQDIRDYHLEELRQKTGLVLQDSFLYYGTIKDNVTLFNDTYSNQDVLEACRFVQADDFIQQYPKGYDHQVIERGASFSSGQKQLLSFARTVIRDPKLLILDEATANIDTETEHAIQIGLERLRKGRTTIVVAHRLSTIKDADTILVLDHGRIVERGNHQALLDLKGIYYKMYQIQQSEALLT